MRSAFIFLALFSVMVFQPGCAKRSTLKADLLLKSRCKGKEPKTIPIGVLLPLSGAYNQYGQAALQGIRLALDSMADDTKYKLLVRDTQADADIASQEFDQLVTVKGVVAVVGPMFTESARRVAEGSQELGLPIFILNGAADIPQIGPFVFRNFFTRESLVRKLLAHATNKLGIQRFAVVAPEDGYGKAYVELFQSLVAEFQGEITKAEIYDPETKNFTKVIQRLVNRHDLESRPDFLEGKERIQAEIKKPLDRKRAMEKLIRSLPPEVDFEAIFIPDTYEKIAMFAPSLAAQDVALKSETAERLEEIKKTLNRDNLAQVYLLGTEAWNQRKLIRWAGRYLQGALFGDGFFVNSTRRATQEFSQIYRARYKKDPGTIHAHAYDTTRMLIKALSTESYCNLEQLRLRIQSIQSFEGATGRISFDENGEAVKDVFLLTIRQRKIIEAKDDPNS